VIFDKRLIRGRLVPAFFIIFTPIPHHIIIHQVQRQNDQASPLGAYLTVALAILLGGGSLLLLAIFLVLGSFTLVDFGLSIQAALVLDSLLCLVFFMQHSGMVRHSFQRRFDAVASKHYRGAVYAISSGLVLLVLLLLWQRTEPVVISIQGPWRLCLHAALLASLVGFLWGVRSLGAFDALGLQPVLERLGNRQSQTMPLAVCGAYRWVRHPLYTSSLLLIWSQPDLTYDRILFNVTWTLWIIVGTVLEERDLLANFGEAYVAYKRKVPMLIPWRIPRND
jgi:protein-S-isoprenylcysteine O-methyltransferase Ste14